MDMFLKFRLISPNASGQQIEVGYSIEKSFYKELNSIFISKMQYTFPVPSRLD